MKHLDTMLRFLTEDILHCRWTFKVRDLNRTQGQDHEGTTLRVRRRVSLGKSNLKDA